MKKGLVLGKFLPFHKGHAALIDFAQNLCDELTVLICAAESEAFSGETRLGWIKDFYKSNPKIKPVLLNYDENQLPNTSASSREVSRKWAHFLKKRFPHFDMVFSSEEYGKFLAEFLNSEHFAFNLQKNIVPVSATLIRRNPFRYWAFLPQAVQPFFVKKICLVGTESTGKSTLTEKLANHFKTEFVPEMAREIIEKTAECSPEHLLQIAELHARQILEKTLIANKLLFVDTDINITRSYSRFLFKRELKVAPWIDEANLFDLYIYLDKRANFIQDGTRLELIERDLLDINHKKTFAERNINFVEINGNWEERFKKCVEVVDKKFFSR